MNPVIKNKIVSTFCSLFSLLTLNLVACKKLAEIPPPVNAISQSNVFETDQTATSVLTGIYGKMSNTGMFTGNESISLLSGLSADELTLYNAVNIPRYVAHYTNNLADNNSSYGSEFWGPLYSYVYICNSAIEGLNASENLTPNVKEQLLGEAKFIRSFFYFYLVNLFGDVPLVLTTDYKSNTLLASSSKEEVYQQIISDLKDAQSLLSNDYLNGALQQYSSSIERTRPSKLTATAMLARVFLFTKDWKNAETEASKVISNATIYDTVPLKDVFLKNSKEAIWQLQPVNTTRNTEEAQCFVLTSTGPTTTTARPVYLSNFLLANFELGDQRKTNWVNSVTVSGTTYYFPFKYKNTSAAQTEYLMVFRLAEQYLIRAEAKAQQDNLIEAKADLNIIRRRARLPNVTTNDKSTIISSIIHERQVELFSEWGHRWLDIKRTNNVDKVMALTTPIKSNGMQWRSYQQLYPIPWNEIEKAPNLGQNFGY
jgi:starch-binding outer membrane protein, SusD/RagB family